MKRISLYKVLCVLVVFVFVSVYANAQPFTITADQGISSIVSSPASACGSNYYFSITTNSNWWKIFYFYDNGVAVTNGTWSISGETFKYVGWNAGMWGREGGGDNTTFYILINPSTKTLTVSTTAPVCGTPAVALAANTVSAANIGQGTTNNVVRSFTLTTTTADATLNTVSFANSTGTANYTDDITNYKLYYTATSSTFATGTLLGTITSGTSFTGLTQSLPVGGPYYFWITADIKSAANAGRSITIDAMATGDFAIASGTKSGSAAVSGTQTIAAPSVTVAAGPAVAAATVGQNTSNHIVSTLAMSVSNASATINSIAFTNTGNADYTNDLTNYKLYYTGTTNTFSTGTLLGTITSGTTFSSLTQNMAVGGPYYYWITADVKTTATPTRTIIISSISNTNITFASGSKSGSNSAGGMQTIIATVPSVTLADNTQVTASNIYVNTNNNVIAKFRLNVSAANTATVNTVSFTTTGDAVTTTDLTNYKLWYSTTNNFSTPAPSLLGTLTTALDAGSHSFTGLTQTITYSTSGYFWITTDVAAGANNTRTVAVSAMTTSDITLASGSKSGSASAAGTQTIMTAVPKNYYYVGANNGDWSTASNWRTGSCGSGVTDGYPSINDNVYINCNNDRVVRLSANSACASLTIGQQNSGVDLYGYSFTVAGSVDFGAGNANRFTNTAGTPNTLSIGGNVLIDNSYQGYMNIPGYSVSVGGNVSLSRDQTYISTTTGSVTITGNLTGGYQSHITTTSGDVTINGNVTFTGSQAKILTTDGDITIGGSYTNTSGSESRIEWSTGTTTITGNISVTKTNSQEPLKCNSTGWFEMNGGLSQTITASNAIAVPKFRQPNTGFTKAGAGGFTVSNIFDQNCGPVQPSGVTITTPANTINSTCGIILSLTTVSGFNYIIGNGPSAEKSFTVEGILLNDDIVISALTNYEISVTSGAGYTTSITLNEVAGSVAVTTIYIRLKADLAKAVYNLETISLSSTGHASKTVTCNGSVSAPLSAALSTLTPTSSSIAADGSSNVSLTVQAKDQDGANITSGGLTVTITKQSGGGTLGAVSDNGDGTYTALLTSPTTTGSAVFVATVNGSQVQNNTGSQTQATITFVAGEPSQLVIQAGNNQTATPGTNVATAPSVMVTDANGNPVSGVDVTFKVTQGNGEVSDIVVVSNASGIATLGYWELGPDPGTNKIVATATSSTTSKSIRYPFPHATRQQYPYGISATNMDYTVFQSKLDTWISNFYTEGDCYGTGDCARIKWDNPAQTVSEGIAYGMLIFVYTDNDANNYKDKFDKLWTYYKKWSVSNGGLMQWQMNGFTSVAGSGAATDADIDVALALIQAHKQWGSDGAVNYIQEAETILAKIYDNEVDGNKLFKPGDQWNDVQNPSYAALFAVKKAMEIQVDESFTQTRDWASVYTALQNYLDHYQNTTTGLWPNWTQPSASGSCVANPGWYTEGCYFGLDALRTPWRVAWDYAWYGTASSAARLDVLADWLNSSSIAGDPNNVIGKFNDITTGTQIAYPLDEPGFVAGLAGAYMANNNVATDQTDLNEWYANLMARDLSNPGALPRNDPLILSDPDTYGYQYYSPTLQILLGLTLTGNTPDFNTLDPVVADPVEFLATGDGLLPITLVSFHANKMNQSVVLDWKTASEQNNDYFTLYRAVTNNNFTPIATVQGAGTSNIMNEYEYLDAQVPQGMLYYQLSQTDYDGKYSYSDIISVYFEPINFEIISCKSDKNGRATSLELQFMQYDEVNIVRIVNVLGQIMFEQKFTQTLYEYITIELPPGMYTIVNSVNNTTSKQKILIK